MTELNKLTELMSAEFPVAPPLPTYGMPTRPRRAMSALDTLRVTLNSVPRHAMGGKRARALNSIGLGCTVEPRRAR